MTIEKVTVVYAHSSAGVHAKVGDLVQVVYAFDEEYKVGDILKVESVEDSGNILARHTIRPHSKILYLLKRDYVVLNVTTQENGNCSQQAGYYEGYYEGLRDGKQQYDYSVRKALDEAHASGYGEGMKEGSALAEQSVERERKVAYDNGLRDGKREENDRITRVDTAALLRGYNRGYSDGKASVEGKTMSSQPDPKVFEIEANPSSRNLDELRNRIVSHLRTKVHARIEEYRQYFDVYHVKAGRTVKVKIKSKKTGELISEGIATANPNDTFNYDIGLYIAFIRATGVPKELPQFLLEIPNAECPAVGDVVHYRSNGLGNRGLRHKVCQSTLDTVTRDYIGDYWKVIIVDDTKRIPF